MDIWFDIDVDSDLGFYMDVNGCVNGYMDFFQLNFF